MATTLVTPAIEKPDVSRFELLMDAGFGAQKAADILLHSFVSYGRYVYIEPMIPAEISPPRRTPESLSGAIIRVANFDLKNTGNDTDVIVAQNEIALDRRLDDKEYNKKCRILLDVGDMQTHEETYKEIFKRVKDMGLKLYTFSLSDSAKEAVKKLSGKGLNMYYLGILSAIYDLPEEIVKEKITKTFGERLDSDILNQNITIFHEGYQDRVSKNDFVISITAARKKEKEEILIDGNTALAIGLIDAGVKVYSGYPITPASSIMHYLAKNLPSFGGIVVQAEDEISAIGTALGSYYGGTPAATGTSGPGLSLKQEFLGFAAVAEIPLIIIDVQRAGPSTGMPTKTEQSDLSAVVWGTHGDHTKVVIGVGNIADCFYAPKLARYIAEKLRMPVFIMSDFQMANSYKVIPNLKIRNNQNFNDIEDYILDHFWMNRLPDNIEMVNETHAVPGTPGKMHTITGLNTNKKGVVNYFASENQRAHEIRNEKVHHVQRALKMPEMFGPVREGEVLVIGWGTTRGVIAEAVHNSQKRGLPVGGLCFRVVYPLPLPLTDILSKFKHVVTVEAAYGDPLKKPPLATLLRSKTLIDVQCILSRATGRPVTPRSIEEKIKEIIENKHV